MCYTVNKLEAKSNDSYKDNLNVVFILDTRVSDSELEVHKKNILDISRTVFKNSPDSRIYIFEQNTDMASDKGYKVYSANGNRFFSDYNILAETLKEVSSSGTTENDAILSDAVGGIISVCDLSRETYAFSLFSQEGVIYRTENGYDFLDNAVEKNVNISVIAEIDNSMIYGYAHDMYKRSGGIILSDTTDYTDAVLKHIYGKKINAEKDTGEYQMILATGLKKVELKEKVTNIYKLHKDPEKEQPNTDDDELPDYDEINFKCELIKFVDDIVELPTYGECIDYKSELTYVKQGLYRFDGQVATGIDFINYVRNNVRVLPISSDPTNADGDQDGLYDDEEYYYNTDPLDYDTDNDKLSDGFEVELWFDPINDNADGDSFSDYEEWINNTSPFVYNMTFQEAKKEFLEGALLGDWVAADSIEKLLGQIAFSFVPFVADARDYFANIFVNLDSWAALANLGGFLLDFTSAGAAGDAAKALSKLEKFVVKHADDVPKVLEAITQAAKIFPKADEVIPGLVKILPVGSIDNIAKSVKNGERITKSDYKQLQNLFEVAEKNLDETFGIILKNADEIDFKPKYLIDELISSGKKVTIEDIEFVLKTPDGNLMWLERGNEKSGLYHILYGSPNKPGHIQDFANRGINDVKTFLYNVVQGTPVKTAEKINEKTGRIEKSAEYIVNGEKYLVAYGDNGYIVSFFPI